MKKFTIIVLKLALWLVLYLILAYITDIAYNGHRFFGADTVSAYCLGIVLLVYPAFAFRSKKNNISSILMGLYFSFLAFAFIVKAMGAVVVYFENDNHVSVGSVLIGYDDNYNISDETTLFDDSDGWAKYVIVYEDDVPVSTLAVAQYKSGGSMEGYVDKIGYLGGEFCSDSDMTKMPYGYFMTKHDDKDSFVIVYSDDCTVVFVKDLVLSDNPLNINKVSHDIKYGRAKMWEQWLSEYNRLWEDANKSSNIRPRGIISDIQEIVDGL